MDYATHKKFFSGYSWKALTQIETQLAAKNTECPHASTVLFFMTVFLYIFQ